MPRDDHPVKTKLGEDLDEFDDTSMASSSEKIFPAQDVKSEREHVQLTWRSWVVVFTTCFAQFAQIFVVAGSGQNITFIARDLGDASLAGWIIQGPLLMQATLGPIIGRLSDVLDRKWLVSIPPLIAFVGAIVSATSDSMSTLIGGGILIGVTLSTISIVQTIPSEILPLKYRAIANGAGFVGSGIGGIIGVLGAGRVTSLSTSGWRNIFWMQAAFHAATALGFFLFYHPPKRSDYPRLSARELMWALDLVGSGLFMVGTTLSLLALDWVAAYGWSDIHVTASLSVGLVSLLSLGVYEWKGRIDGVVAHVFCQKSPNFALATIALAIDGWCFYSAVNTVVPQLTLNLGFEHNSWSISVRQLSASLTTLAACIPITWVICYALITPNLDSAQIGYNVLVSVGQAGPLTLLVAVIQLAVPHEHLSTATGLAFSARAIGGAFGSAVLTAIIGEKLKSSYAVNVGAAAEEAGLPKSSVSALLAALQAGDTGFAASLPGSSGTVVVAAIDAAEWVYARAYRLAWASIIPFVVVALVCVLLLRSVKELMTDQIEASVEPRAKKLGEVGEKAA